MKSPIHSTVVAALTLAGALLAIGISSAPQMDPRQFDWIEGTTWYVRPAGLPIMVYDASNELALPSVTQTVYTIDHCNYGYFRGHCTVMQGGMDIPNCYQLIGSVTPAGDVQLNFVRPDGEGGWSRTTATGRMTRMSGSWVMVNQVCGEATAGGQYSLHWAPMWQVEPGDIAWDRLPWIDMSVPDFMAQCE